MATGDMFQYGRHSLVADARTPDTTFILSSLFSTSRITWRQVFSFDCTNCPVFLLLCWPWAVRRMARSSAMLPWIIYNRDLIKKDMQINTYKRFHTMSSNSYNMTSLLIAQFHTSEIMSKFCKRWFLFGCFLLSRSTFLFLYYYNT